LDEPLGALDRKLRKAMQLELKHMQRTLEITFIYVTHDQEEAITMSDRIAVMRQGHVLQVGSPVEIYEAPNCKFVADFIGESNFLPGVVRDLDANRVQVEVGGQHSFNLTLPAFPLHLGQETTLMVRPEKGTLCREAGSNDDYCFVPGRILEVIYLGEDISYVVALTENLHVVIRSQNVSLMGPESFKTGEQVYVRWLVDHLKILGEES
jgi:spermidine/putrescine transport system ATP-binding protein